MSPKEQQELKSYVNHLYVIDSQQALFELSHRLEPRAWAASICPVTTALKAKGRSPFSVLLPVRKELAEF